MAVPANYRRGDCTAMILVFTAVLFRWIAICGAQCESPCEGVNSYTIRQEPLPKDCKDISNRGVTKSGVYTIFPQDVYLCISLRVYCDMDTDGGGWTVLQRRYDNRFDFNARWMDYRLGFGSLSSEFWLGNEHLHHITVQDDYLLRVEMEDFEGEKRTASYDYFRLGSETDNYRLYIGNYTGGDAGDSLSDNGFSSFSTRDSDLSGGRCVSFRGGAWWYPQRCGDSNLNGAYLPRGTHTDFGGGVLWRSWRGLTYSLRGSKMMFRPMTEADRSRAPADENAGDEDGDVGDGEVVVDAEDEMASGEEVVPGETNSPIQPRKADRNKGENTKLSKGG